MRGGFVKIAERSKIMYLQMLSNYLKQYRNQYPENAVEYIQSHFFSDIKAGMVPDILMQIYGEFDMIPKSENYYLKFAQEIGKIYGWDTRFLEIGGGFFPTFSKYLSNLQTEHHGSGTVTVYDPTLVVASMPNISLHKEKFTEETDISEYDVLIGIYSCEATELIIEKAVISHKEFYIGMCGCVPDKRHTSSSFYHDYRNWLADLEKLAKKQEQYGYQVELRKNSEMFYPHPVIYSKKIK